VAACVLAGVRLLGAADHTVGVWALRSDQGAGALLSRSDLAVHRVHFARPSDLEGYLRADAALPRTLTLVRPVGAGELLPRAAIGSADASDAVQVPLAVDPAQVPPAVASGSVVDVYVLGRAGADPSASARSGPQKTTASPALSAVTVVAAPRADDVFGGSQTKRQLTLAVPEEDAQAFFGLLDGLNDPTVAVVLRPAG